MTQWPFWGTVVNTVAVFFGAMLGLLVRAVIARKKSPEAVLPEGEAEKPRRNVADLLQKGLGLCVVLIGISGALEAQKLLVVILAIVLGGITGELLDLDGLLARFGLFVERRFRRSGEGNIAEGFVTATLLFCVGAMTVNGALEGALLYKHDIYYAKSMLDMVAAAIFASSLGVGVALSSVGVFVVQGTLTLIAVLAGNVIPVAVVTEMMAVGSLLVLAIGLNLLGITKIRVMNLVPAIFFTVGLYPLFVLLGL